MKVIEAGNSEFPQLWSRLWQDDAVQHPFGTPLDVEYSKAYSAGVEFKDRSFLVRDQCEPVLGVQIALARRPGNRLEISAFGRPVHYLQARNSTPDQVKCANKFLKEKLLGILHEAPGASVLFSDFLPNGKLSFLGQCLLDEGARATPCFTQLLSLSSSEEELKAAVRKSYKSFINWGMKHLAIRIIDKRSVTPADMERFRLLHIQEAGRETRSSRTWEIQCQQVKQGEAFLVLGEFSGELATAALFIHSDRHCYYGVGASVRALFDKPLSHVIIWCAILHARSMGCSMFELGERLFPAQGNPSAKELGISAFKRGFGGETSLRLMIVREAPAN